MGLLRKVIAELAKANISRAVGGGAPRLFVFSAYSVRVVVRGLMVKEKRSSKVDTETRKRIEDYFEGYELVEFLQLPVSEIIERFEDEIEAYLDEIEELMGVRERKGWES